MRTLVRILVLVTCYWLLTYFLLLTAYCSLLTAYLLLLTMEVHENVGPHFEHDWLDPLRAYRARGAGCCQVRNLDLT